MIDVVLVDVTFGVERWNKIKAGKVIGWAAWSPPDKPRWRYPFVVYDYSRFRCVEWRGICCERSVGEYGEGDLFYVYNYVQVGKRHGSFSVGTFRVKEGAEYVSKRMVAMGIYEFFKARNLEVLEDDRSIKLRTLDLTLEATRRDLTISRSSMEENLLAMHLIVDGLIPEEPVKPPLPAYVAPAIEPVRDVTILSRLGLRPRA